MKTMTLTLSLALASCYAPSVKDGQYLCRFEADCAVLGPEWTCNDCNECVRHDKIETCSNDGATVDAAADAKADAEAPLLGSYNLPATSCREILLASASRGDGIYYLTYGTATRSPAWCDMSTDGGGWTALLSPSQEALPDAPELVASGVVLSSTHNSCSPAPVPFVSGGWNGVRAYVCGDATLKLSITWPNRIGATDAMLVAALQGQTAHSLTINDATLPADAISVDAAEATCWFHNGTMLSSHPEENTCWLTSLDAPPRVYRNILRGDLRVEIVVGASSQPNSRYGAGGNIYRLFVR